MNNIIGNKRNKWSIIFCQKKSIIY